jgi:hypothetical protein
MSATTLIAPQLEPEVEQLRPIRNGNATSRNAQAAPADSELKKLSEQELKAAIKSAWKTYERLAKKEMGQLLYWLREKLRAQGSRNDLREQDKGFGAWVEETIEISRRTADRWADEYGLANGLMKRKRTSRQHDQKSFAHSEDGFLEAKRRKHLRQIQLNYWIPLGQYQRHEESVKVLKKHFKTTSTQDAIVKGVEYAAQSLASGRGRTRRGSVASISRTSRHKQKAASNS